MRLAKIIAMLYVTMNLSGCGVDVVTPFSPQYLETSFNKKFSKPSSIIAAEGMADHEKLKLDYMQYKAEISLQRKADTDFFELYTKELSKRSYKDYPKP